VLYSITARIGRSPVPLGYGSAQRCPHRCRKYDPDPLTLTLLAPTRKTRGDPVGEVFVDWSQVTGHRLTHVHMFERPARAR